MTKTKKLILPEPSLDVNSFGEYVVKKLIPENEKIQNQNPNLAAVLDESVEAEIALEGYHNSLIWLPFSTIYNNIRKSEIELSNIFGDEVMAGFIMSLYDKTWSSLTMINESVFKNLRRCKVDEKFKNRFEKKNREVLKYNQFLFKLKVDENEHMQLSLQLGDFFLITHFKRLIKNKDYEASFKEFGSHKILYLGLLKTLLDNNFKEIKTNDLIDRESTFKIGNSQTIKVHVNVYLDKFISDYDTLRKTILDYNQILGHDPLASDFLTMLISLLELDSIDYLTSHCAIRLYHLSFSILQNENEAKLLTHFFLNACGISGLTSIHEFEKWDNPSGEYRKLRIKEVDRILNQYS